MWGHHYSVTALRVAVARDTESETEKGKNAEWNTSPSLLYCEPHTPVPAVYITAVLPAVESSHFYGKWDSLCHEDWWSPLTSATEALSSKIASGPFCLCSLKAFHILCLSAVDFEHAPVPVLIGRRIIWASWGGSFPSSMLKVHSTSILQGPIE